MIPTKTARALGFVLLMSLTVPLAAFAQATTASILGRVQDSTGGVLPGVTVTVTNLETGISRTAVSDDQGRYAMTQLALGDNYQVRGELAGFQASTRRGIALTLGREAVVDLMLAVGDISEDIVVTGEAPLVETTHAVVSGRVDARQMRELPLNSRSYIDLSLLQAGTLSARTGTSTSLGDTGTALTVAGARPTATTFLLDGTSTTSVRGKAPASVAGTALGVDSIREFEVVTSPFSAEYGRGTGGTISVVSKAGTNTLHGSLFEFLRHSKLDSPNYFDPPGDLPPFKRNQFGGSLGGPAVRNRMFFFGNYEGLRQDLSTTAIYKVPNERTRQGILPAKTVAINPAVKPYLELFPHANGRDFGDGTAEYSGTAQRVTTENYVTSRIDQQMSGSQSLFVRYTYSHAEDTNPGNLLEYLYTASSRSHFLTAEYKIILSSRLLNVTRFGFTRHNILATEAAQIDIPANLSVQSGVQMPNLSTSGLSQLGSSDMYPQGFVDDTFDFYDSLTYSRGRHTLKAGTQLQFLRNDAQLNNRQASRWNFGTLESFLLGQANRVQIAPRQLADPLRHFRQKFSASYFQDDVRLTPRLTLNLGVRAEYAGTISEADGKISVMPLDHLQTATFDDIQTVGSNPWYRNPGVTWGPRVGLAWDPTGSGRTAVRGGVGMFYDHLWAWWSSGVGAFRMGPYYNTFDLRENLPFPMAASQFVTLLQQRQKRQVPFGNQVFEPPPDPKRQHVLQYGLDVQHQLPGSFVAKLGYKGSRGANLGRVVDLNTAVPIGVTDGVPLFSARPSALNPAFGTMNLMPTDSQSFYNALLFEVSKRFNHGWSLQTAYTFSKMIDEGSGVRTSGDAVAGAGGGTVLSYQFRTLDRALSTFDVRHNLVTNVGLQLPFGANRPIPLTGVANALLGGWEINSIVALSSGNPAEVSMGTTSTTILLGGRRRPDLVPGGNNNPVLGGPDKYFDASQFKPADPQRFGTVGRNTLIGPGFANMDLSLVKTVQVRTYRVSLRGEMFNVLNRANFSLPDMQVFDGSGRPNGGAGRISATTAPARQVQLGLRVDW